VVAETARRHGGTGDVEIEISVPGGEALAKKTLNPRLGIAGGLSILGTTGIVKPFSCSAWIYGIREGIDVARAAGLTHVAGATGSTSEAAVKALYGLPDHALIDMGDFVGAMLKHLRAHPIERVTIAGGFGKLTKLAQGMLDLHSGRSEVDFEWLAARAGERGADEALKGRIHKANTAAEALSFAHAAGIDLAAAVAEAARETALATLRGAPVEIEIVVFDRKGEVLARGT
jgi:cobalt-precorrin-5B (C1)-methyltransferase